MTILIIIQRLDNRLELEKPAPAGTVMPNRYQDESVLIADMLTGSDAAFRYAIQHYNGIMRHLACGIAGDAIADEVVQEAWLSVIKSLPQFEGRASLKTWILSIVCNGAKTRLRKESRSIAMGDGIDMERSLGGDTFDADGHWSHPPRTWHADTPEALLSSQELQARIWEAIDQLPPLQRSVLTLREMDGLAMEDICKILDISASNSRVLLHRARAIIWQVIDKYENTV